MAGKALLYCDFCLDQNRMPIKLEDRRAGDNIESACPSCKKSLLTLKIQVKEALLAQFEKEKELWKQRENAYIEQERQLELVIKNLKEEAPRPDINSLLLTPKQAMDLTTAASQAATKAMQAGKTPIEAQTIYNETFQKELEKFALAKR